jgi:hypothetical protein
MIRGMVYLDLLRTYGEHWNSGSIFGVPIRTSPTVLAEFTPRSTVAQTYNRIITDLINAEAKLPDNFDPAYASRQAATALLARTYLYMKDYANAYQYATEVINSGMYDLNENYSEIYEEQNTTESIFELNFSVQDPSYYLREYGERDEATISPDFYDQFEDEDSRKSTIFPDIDNESLLTTQKYVSQSASAFIIRIAEMYTIRAEATAISSNNITDALEDLNRLRWRANLSSLQETDIPDVDSFMNALLEEKRKEFYGEGHRYFDLARTQKFEEVYGIENFRSIFPIPFIEILTANSLGETLAQNPGY